MAPAAILMKEYFQKRISDAEAAKTKAELEKKYLENRNEVEKANSGKSDDDIIDEHLKGK